MNLQQELDQLEMSVQNNISAQQRGLKFEKWLNRLIVHAGMHPRTSYRPRGEEIDGSFIYCGRTFLLEAKWIRGKIPASTLYQFKGKVDGKLVGTIGVFISMSDYSPDSVDALRVGKDLNLILFNKEDVLNSAICGFEAVLAFKLRSAAEFGDVFVPYQPPTPFATGRLAIVVESQLDRMLIIGLAEKLREAYGEIRDYAIYFTMGLNGLAPAASAAAQDGNQVLIIADGKGDKHFIHHRLQQLTADGKVKVIAVDPTINRWVSLSSDPRTRISPQAKTTALKETDVRTLIKVDPEFAEFASVLGVEH